LGLRIFGVEMRVSNPLLLSPSSKLPKATLRFYRYKGVPLCTSIMLKEGNIVERVGAEEVMAFC
jgi:hypothetical protein